jgi:cellulose synthase (UDP-forming)
MNADKEKMVDNKREEFDPTKTFLENTQVSKNILFLTNVLALGYFNVMLFFVPPGNVFLFWLLIVGEVFHLWQVLGLVMTVWDTESAKEFDPTFQPPVDVLITVAGEPLEIVRQTSVAAKNMNYPNFRVYILNDGKVAGKDNWQEVENLAEVLGIGVITRSIAGGAKAGNINNGLRHTSSAFLAIFDADHVPDRDFLKKTMGYFFHPDVAFVQTPQYYKNYNQNLVTRGAWRQQELFFGAICKGKNATNSVFMCGTNMIFRREAIEEVGGMCETNIAEDFLTSLFVHAKGWKSVYVPEVLAQGLAPEDFLSYYKQQFRWARGSLEVIFYHNPLWMKSMTWGQKFQYLFSASYYLSGVVVLLNIMLPLFFFYFGAVPVIASSMVIPMIFLPYIFMVMFVLQKTSNFSYTFEALAFSIGSFYLQMMAIWGVLSGQKTSFSVTSKTKLSGNFLYLNNVHLAYIFLGLAGVSLAVSREGVSTSVITNTTWLALNIVAFGPFLLASMGEDQLSWVNISRIFRKKVSV